MMTRKEKAIQMQQLIAERLGNLVDRDYVLMGLPYYLNVGDILIWEGERQFLKPFHHKCLNEGFRYRDTGRIQNDTLILLQGGGNFGDLWRFIQEERLNVIQRYQSNPIIITPVTYWYENNDLVQYDAEIMSKHSNLTICARDVYSFELLNKYFDNPILLVPDMAFYIDRTSLGRHTKEKGEGTLFLKRTDKELSPQTPSMIDNIANISDWPSMETDPPFWIRYMKLCNYADIIGSLSRMKAFSNMILKLSDWYFHNHCRKQLILDGACFVDRYSNIYTTRLHVGILAMLLDKNVTFIDNSYGKISNFFETWLTDTDGVELQKI